MSKLINGIGKYTQDTWVNKMNKDGRVLASMPDIYACGTEVKEVLKSITLPIYQYDENVITSTKIQYSPKSDKGKIIHYAGSTLIDPIEIEVSIPFYDPCWGGNGEIKILSNPYNDRSRSEKHLRFFQALFLTNDNFDKIKDKLSYRGAYCRTYFKIGTLSLSERSQSQIAYPIFFTHSGIPPHGYKETIMCTRPRISGLACSVDEPTKSKSQLKKARKKSKSQLKKARKPEFKIPEFHAPSNLEAKIDAATNSITFSEVANHDGVNQLSSLICFQDKKYVLLATFNTDSFMDHDRNIAQILAVETSTENKLKSLNEALHSSYSKLSLYKDGEEVDSLEHFEGGKTK